MARNVEYTPSDAGFKAMRNGPEVLAACVDIAEKGMAYAISISPRESGEYADSFQVVPTTVTFEAGDFPGPRAAARLENTSAHAAAVEWGNVSESRGVSKPHRVLGRTLDHLAGGA